MGPRWFNLIFVRFNSLALFFILFFRFFFVVLYFYTVCTARYSNGIHNIGFSRVVSGLFCFFGLRWSDLRFVCLGSIVFLVRMVCFEFILYFYYWICRTEHVGIPCLFYVLVLWMVVCLGSGSAMVCSALLIWFNCLTL